MVDATESVQEQRDPSNRGTGQGHKGGLWFLPALLCMREAEAR